MGKRFTMLQILALLIQLFAVLGGIGGVLLGLLVATAPSYHIDAAGKFITTPNTNPYPGLGIALAVVIFAIGFFAFGQLVQLLIALEQNTRETTIYLSRLRGGGVQSKIATGEAKGVSP